MFAIIQAEFQKMKRYHILLIGIFGMACSPLLQMFSQAVMAEEYKNQHFDFAALVNATIWGNATIFLPVLVTLIGGYLINREYADDTLKNILTVPVSFRRLLAGKLAAITLLAVILGVFSMGITVIVSLCAGLPALNPLALARGTLQTAGLAVGVCVVTAPLTILCSRRPGSFMSGSVVAFIAGYSCMFFKNGIMRDIYPFSAVLTLIGFDSTDWAGTSERGSLLWGAASLGVMLLLSLLLLGAAKPPETAQKRRRKKGRAARRGRSSNKRTSLQ